MTTSHEIRYANTFLELDLPPLVLRRLVTCPGRLLEKEIGEFHMIVEEEECDIPDTDDELDILAPAIEKVCDIDTDDECMTPPVFGTLTRNASPWAQLMTSPNSSAGSADEAEAEKVILESAISEMGFGTLMRTRSSQKRGVPLDLKGMFSKLKELKADAEKVDEVCPPSRKTVAGSPCSSIPHEAAKVAPAPRRTLQARKPAVKSGMRLDFDQMFSELKKLQQLRKVEDSDEECDLPPLERHTQYDVPAMGSTCSLEFDLTSEDGSMPSLERRTKVMVDRFVFDLSSDDEVKVTLDDVFADAEESAGSDEESAIPQIEHHTQYAALVEVNAENTASSSDDDAEDKLARERKTEKVPKRAQNVFANAWADMSSDEDEPPATQFAARVEKPVKSQRWADIESDAESDDGRSTSSRSSLLSRSSRRSIQWGPTTLAERPAVVEEAAVLEVEDGWTTVKKRPTPRPQPFRAVRATRPAPWATQRKPMALPHLSIKSGVASTEKVSPRCDFRSENRAVTCVSDRTENADDSRGENRAMTTGSDRAEKRWPVERTRTEKVPVNMEDGDFPVVRRLIGPGGSHLKRIGLDCKASIMLRGRGCGGTAPLHVVVTAMPEYMPAALEQVKALVNKVTKQYERSIAVSM